MVIPLALFAGTGISFAVSGSANACRRVSLTACFWSLYKDEAGVLLVLPDTTGAGVRRVMGGGRRGGVTVIVESWSFGREGFLQKAIGGVSFCSVVSSPTRYCTHSRDDQVNPCFMAFWPCRVTRRTCITRMSYPSCWGMS